MGMAMIQCRNHSSHDINGACKCVTVKVIMPVAVTAVSSCNMNRRIIHYICANGSTGQKNSAAYFFARVTLHGPDGEIRSDDQRNSTGVDPTKLAEMRFFVISQGIKTVKIWIVAISASLILYYCVVGIVVHSRCSISSRTMITSM